MVDDSVFDRNAALAVVDGRWDILVEIAQTFLDHYPALLAPLEKAVKRSDIVGVANAAHDLKGSLSFFGPTSAAARASELEQMAAEGRPDAIDQAHVALQKDVNDLASALTQLVAAS